MNVERKKYQAILFDSGRVLNEPASGHWHIPPRFFEFVNKPLFLSISASRRKEAFRQAYAYLDQHLLIRTEAEEFAYSVQFYRLLANRLPELELGEAAINAIAYDLVNNSHKYRFYPEVLTWIPRLSTQVKLAVVSDAWPSLERVYEEAGLRPYFSSFIISSQLGTAKPDPAMYCAALEELGVPAELALFVDDHPGNCEGAEKLGIPALVLNRDIRTYRANRLLHWRKKCTYIRSIAEMNKRFLQMENS
ncbi:HAD family hydrolase [Gorillibacterium timonense]|uniref:HAD family hydrolase n=1 Tax=Gorillibacterium timonense TaxID=1689269 RepID=UPI00071DD615|nr:HAD-IA family hydrolase [Gorillibacterium timonense]